MVRSANILQALKDIGTAIQPVWMQFALVVLLTMGIGATKKLSFTGQSVMAKTTYADDWSSTASQQQKYIAFGFAKAIANLAGAVFSDLYGKKPVLLVGWSMGLIHCGMNFFEIWPLTVWSNIFLGFQQGICWSLMIFMMVDMAGPANRAMAVGLNETAGYTAVAIFGKIGPEIWGQGTTNDPYDGDKVQHAFYGMTAFMGLGLLATLTVLKDTRPIVVGEQQERFKSTGKSEFTETTTYIFPSGQSKNVSVFRFAFVETSFLNNSLMAACLAGLGINYMTTFAWGLGKKMYSEGGPDYSLVPCDFAGCWAPIKPEVSDDITLTYDLTKGVLQFIFGFYSDRSQRKMLVCSGLVVNFVALIIWSCVAKYSTTTDAATNGFFVAAFMLGLGTSMMYAVVIAAVGESADPSWRSSAVGAYRFWRDSGYAFGGLLLAYVTDNSGRFDAVIVSACIMLAIATNFFFFFEEVVEDDLDMGALNTAVASGEFVMPELAAPALPVVAATTTADLKTEDKAALAAPDDLSLDALPVAEKTESRGCC